MDTKRSTTRVARQVVHVVALALLSAACWWVWMAWDRTYYVDPDTGLSAGPYEPWQVVGCVLCLIGVAIAGTWLLPAWVVIVTMPIAFTTAWALTAWADDPTGLWAVGAVLVGVGMLAGTTVVALGTVVARWATRGRRQRAA